MDKLLDFVVAYIKEIFDKAEINWKQLILLLIVFSFLSFIAIKGYLNKGENNVLKSMAEFSFYTCVVMILLGIIGIGGRTIDRKKEMAKYIEILRNILTYEKEKNLINYYNEKKGILVVYKKPRKYEINIWLNDDEYFGKVYVYFIDSKLQKKALDIKGLKQDKNGFDKCLNYKETDNINTPDDIKEAVNEIREELEKIDN